MSENTSLALSTSDDSMLNEVSMDEEVDDASSVENATVEMDEKQVLKQEKMPFSSLPQTKKAKMNADVITTSELIPSMENILRRLYTETNIETSVFGKMAVLPGLEVKGYGLVPLPINEDIAAKLISIAQQSPYGKGRETLVNTTVRDSHQFEASEIVINNPAWKSVMERVIVDVAEGFGFQSIEIVASLYKLLLYKKGGHFLPHKDTDKEAGMFGTLIIQLPSVYTGGELVVSLNGKSKKYDFGVGTGSSPYFCHYAAHFADLEHEILEVKSGYRLALIYSLHSRPGAPLISIPTTSLSDDCSSNLKSLLSQWHRANSSQMLIYLDHEYSEKGLSNGAVSLKGKDKLIYDVLAAANKKLSFAKRINFLFVNAQLTVSYSGSGYSRYNVDWEENCRDSKISEAISVSGKILKIPKLKIKTENLVNFQDIDVDDLCDLWGDPDDEDIESYTGNAGPEKTETYSRYFLVIIPSTSCVDWSTDICEKLSELPLEIQKVRQTWGSIIPMTASIASDAQQLEGNTILVGRDTTRSKVLFSDLNVSSVHCSIERTVNDDRKNVVFIRDYSMSGTYLYSEETKVLEKIEKDQSREVSSGTEVILIPSGANQDRVSFIIKFEDLQNIQVSESEIFYNRLLQSCLNLISFWQNNIGSDNDFSSLAEVLSSFCELQQRLNLTLSITEAFLASLLQLAGTIIKSTKLYQNNENNKVAFGFLELVKLLGVKDKFSRFVSLCLQENAHFCAVCLKNCHNFLGKDDYTYVALITILKTQALSLISSPKVDLDDLISALQFIFLLDKNVDLDCVASQISSPIIVATPELFLKFLLELISKVLILNVRFVISLCSRLSIMLKSNIMTSFSCNFLSGMFQLVSFLFPTKISLDEEIIFSLCESLLAPIENDTWKFSWSINQDIYRACVLPASVDLVSYVSIFMYVFDIFSEKTRISKLLSVISLKIVSLPSKSPSLFLYLNMAAFGCIITKFGYMNVKATPLSNIWSAMFDLLSYFPSKETNSAVQNFLHSDNFKNNCTLTSQNDPEFSVLISSSLCKGLNQGFELTNVAGFCDCVKNLFLIGVIADLKSISQLMLTKLPSRDLGKFISVLHELIGFQALVNSPLEVLLKKQIEISASTISANASKFVIPVRFGVEIITFLKGNQKRVKSADRFTSIIGARKSVQFYTKPEFLVFFSCFANGSGSNAYVEFHKTELFWEYQQAVYTRDNLEKKFKLLHPGESFVASMNENIQSKDIVVEKRKADGEIIDLT